MPKTKLSPNLKILLGLALVAGLLFCLYQSLPKHRYLESAPAKELFSGDQRLLADPISPNHFAVAVTPESKPVIEIPLSGSIDLNGFSLFFYGNLHAVSSYLPIAFDIHYRDAEGKWQLVEQVRNHQQAVYQLKLQDNRTVRGFRVDLIEAAHEELVEVGDLKFYYHQSLTIPEQVLQLTSQSHKGLAAYFIYSLGFYLLLLIPGYAFLDYYKFKIKDPGFKLIAGPLISVLIIGLASAGFLTTNQVWVLYLIPLAFLISSYLFFRNQNYQEVRNHWVYLFPPLAAITIVSLLQAQRDFVFNLHYIENYLDSLRFVPLDGGYFGYHADNTLQWGIARSWLHQVPMFSPEADQYRVGFKGFSVLDRTPLLPTIIVPLLYFFGESHFVYQKFLNVLMALYYGAAYLLIRQVISKKIAVMVSVMLLISGPLTFSIINTEVYMKYFSIYPMMLAALLVILNKEPVIVGILAAVAFLIHPMNAIFIVVAILLYMVRYRSQLKKLVQTTLVVVGPTMTIGVLWFLIGNYIRQQAPLDSSVVAEKQNLYLKVFGVFTFASFMNRLFNFANLFVPDFLLNRFGGEDKTFWSIEYLRNFLRYSVVGVISPFFLALGGWKLFSRNLRHIWSVLWFGAVPIILFLLLLPNYSYGGYALLYPFTVPFLLAFTVYKSMSIPSRMVRAILGLSYVLFMLPFLYYQSGIFIQLQYVWEFITGIKLALLTIYTLLSLYLLYQISQPGLEDQLVKK